MVSESWIWLEGAGGYFASDTSAVWKLCWRCGMVVRVCGFLPGVLSDWDGVDFLRGVPSSWVGPVGSGSESVNAILPAIPSQPHVT